MIKWIIKWWYKRRGYTFPEDYGAKGDGVTDDTQAIKLAINTCTRGIRFGVGKTYRVASRITIPPNLTIDYLK